MNYIFSLEIERHDKRAHTFVKSTLKFIEVVGEETMEALTPIDKKRVVHNKVYHSKQGFINLIKALSKPKETQKFIPYRES